MKNSPSAFMNPQPLISRLIKPAPFLAICLATGSSWAVDKTWTSGAQSAWATAGNWSPSGAPTSGDDVVTPSAFGNILFNVSSGTVNSWTYNSASSQSIIGNNGAGGATLTISGTLSKSGSGTLTYRNSSTTNPLVLSIGSVSLSGGQLLFGQAGLNALTGFTAGSLTATSGTTSFAIGAASGTATITGAVTLSGASVVSVREAGGAGQSGSLSVGSLVSGDATTVVRVNPNSSNAATGTLILNNASGTATFAGSVQNGGTAANVMNVVKNGNGVQVFGGANTYTGSTVINAGSLLISGTHTGAGAYTVSGGELGGTGLITTAGTAGTTVGAGAAIAPGSGGIGTLTFSGSSTTGTVLSLLTDAEIRMELGTAGLTISAPGTSDALAFASAASGDVVFNNTNIDFLGTGSVGYYKVLDTDLVSGTTWTGLTLSGQTITGGLVVTNLGTDLTGTLIVGDGTIGDFNDIYLQVSAVPEPGSILLFGAGLAFLLGKVRRRVA